MTFDAEVPSLEPHQITAHANRALSAAKARARVESSVLAYRGYALSCTAVLSAAEIKAIGDYIHGSLLKGFPSKWDLTLPQSKSFLRMLDVPRYRSDGSQTRSKQVEQVMAQSALAPHFILAGKPRCIPDSKRSATLTVFFEVWDSQAGSRAKALVGHTLHFGSSTCKIVTANKSPSVPLCQRCWKWGHPQQACKARHLRCPRCSEPHLLDDH